MTEQKKDVADVALEPYWAAAREGRLLLKRCRACGQTHYYPRAHCPFCLADDGEWIEASGVGAIYSWSVERRGQPPYAIAFVMLAEGP
ncbi:MAG: Zn-ribbon domain-containing OB-fold protein, partial [Gammaproteobacteria bacterium]